MHSGAFSRHFRLKLLDLRERQTCTFCDFPQHEFTVGEQPLRHREHGLALALGLGLDLAAFHEFFNCFAHGVPPFF